MCIIIYNIVHMLHCEKHDGFYELRQNTNASNWKRRNIAVEYRRNVEESKRDNAVIQRHTKTEWRRDGE